nr:hypothetical protein DS993_20755 [Escherichia coli]
MSCCLLRKVLSLKPLYALNLLNFGLLGAKASPCMHVISNTLICYLLVGEQQPISDYQAQQAKCGNAPPARKILS